jgi:hypothetical protein
VTERERGREEKREWMVWARKVLPMQRQAMYNSNNWY